MSFVQTFLILLIHSTHRLSTETPIPFPVLVSQLEYTYNLPTMLSFTNQNKSLNLTKSGVEYMVLCMITLSHVISIVYLYLQY